MRKKNESNIRLNSKKNIIVIIHYSFFAIYSTALFDVDSSGNFSFPSSSGNSSSPTPSNSSASIPNKNNSSSSANGGSSSQDSISDFILVPLLSLTIIFAVAYIILILIRPTFRANRLS